MSEKINRIMYFGDKLETSFSEIKRKFEKLNAEEKQKMQENLEKLGDEIKGCWLESEGILAEINELGG